MSVALFSLAIIWFIAALILFVLPNQEPLQKADAVVVLSPPNERLPVAIDAFEEGLADQLWISFVARDLEFSVDRSLIEEMCASDPQTIECFVPSSEDTIGEAQAVAQLIRETEVRSVVVVTHTSHSSRARFLFERCLPEGVQVEFLLVEESTSPADTMRRMLYESAASVKAAVEIYRCGIR